MNAKMTADSALSRMIVSCRPLSVKSNICHTAAKAIPNSPKETKGRMRERPATAKQTSMNASMPPTATSKYETVTPYMR